MRVPIAAGAVLALVLFGCGGGGGNRTASPGAPTSGGPTGTPAAAAVICGATGSGTAVSIADFTYNPNSATEAVNGFVNWTNNDGAAHTVTFDSGPDCGQLSGGGTVTAQFTVAGAYPYHCAIHPNMHGSVVIS
ncbi:MAG TPA: hypothetical protein VM284_02730 [Candidatus Limnocylindria bacterium]|nr:hypothetical protein [Candidatus Limnocylindria bacterium]